MAKNIIIPTVLLVLSVFNLPQAQGEDLVIRKNKSLILSFYSHGKAETWDIKTKLSGGVKFFDESQLNLHRNKNPDMMLKYSNGLNVSYQNIDVSDLNYLPSSQGSWDDSNLGVLVSQADTLIPFNTPQEAALFKKIMESDSPLQLRSVVEFKKGTVSSEKSRTWQIRFAAQKTFSPLSESLESLINQKKISHK